MLALEAQVDALGDGFRAEFQAGLARDLEFASEDVTLLVASACSELLDGAKPDYLEINAAEHRSIFNNLNDPAHKASKPGG